MSEYQYYEFAAVDRPLSRQQQDELRSLSTRADITSTSFVNSYEWGDFKGDPQALMEEYFDAHLYLANWGTRRLMLRLPVSLLDPETVAEYFVSEAASALMIDGQLVLDMVREDEDDEEDDTDGDGLLASIIPVRAELAAGDVRLLYLAWLRCAQSEELEDDEPEPPVPAGLGELSASLTAVVEFLHINPDLVEAAAAASAPLAVSQPSAAQLRSWITGLPTTDKDEILGRLITGTDPNLRNELLRRHRGKQPEAPATTKPRTAGELLDTAASLEAVRKRRPAE